MIFLNFPWYFYFDDFVQLFLGLLNRVRVLHRVEQKYAALSPGQMK